MKRLDPRDNPDRFYDPEPPPVLPRGLDLRRDPDRFDNATLIELVGRDGAFEDERDNPAWLFGLLGVFAFLALVAALFPYVLSP